MIFGTFDFFIFLAATVAVYWFLKPFPAARKIFLAAASGYYYWLVDPRFAGLLALAGMATFFLARKAGEKNRTASLMFWLGISVNLGILLGFKYYDFFRVSAQSFLSPIGLGMSLPFYEIAFPIGISFYSFRMISYLIDVRRKNCEPEKSIVDFSVYAFFFPCMLAGPIMRAESFLPQLKNCGPRQPREINMAAAMLFLGLFKKIIISSWLAQNLVDDVFAVPEQISAAAAWLAALGYTFQIYCDFSGYSDIAIAAAMFLGFQLAPNFEYPYRAKTIAEFWQKWHISFYSWMRDYVYIPLGGSRRGKARTYINTMAVFALSGLWHGAAGHYLLWGLWHGAGLCVQRFWQQSRRLKTKTDAMSGAGAWLFTFLFVGAGWIIFRAENIPRAQAFIKAMADFKAAPVQIIPVVLICLVTFFIFFEKNIFEWLVKCQNQVRGVAWPVFWIAATGAIYYFAPQTVPPFIYFSF